MEPGDLDADACFEVPVFRDHDTEAERFNKQVVLDTWRAFWRNDIEAGLANMAADVHWWNSGDGPLGSNLHGHDAIRRARGSELDFFRDLVRTVIGYHAAGEVVIMEARATGHLRDGTPYQNEACVVYELQHGKIARVRHYVDTKKADAVRAMLERTADR